MRAMFLDRDGIINVDTGYVGSREGFIWQEGIFDLARSAHHMGLAIVVVTNQSGIGRGYFGEVEFHLLTQWMSARFAREGAPLTAVYYCPFHPEAAVSAYRQDHWWRKPRPGMFLAARDAHGINLAASIAIGDQARDIEAAHAAGINTTVHVAGTARQATVGQPRATLAVGSVLLASKWLVANIEPANARFHRRPALLTPCLRAP